MAQVTNGIRAFLSSPVLYTAFQNLMGARKGWVRFVKEFVKPEKAEKILDIGCGPADLLEHLPEVDYWGYDISNAYIGHAMKRYGNRGRFYCKVLTREDLSTLPRFDIVVASGVLHHMDDKVAEDFLLLAHEALRPGGRLVTIDPCWVVGQHPCARFLIAQDRGQNVRTEAGYESLVTKVFQERRVLVRHKAWIPYTHCFMECVRR